MMLRYILHSQLALTHLQILNNFIIFKSLLFIRQSYLIMQGTAESAWRILVNLYSA